MAENKSEKLTFASSSSDSTGNGSSNAKDILRQPLKLEYRQSHSASFVSQRSSSVESFESPAHQKYDNQLKARLGDSGDAASYLTEDEIGSTESVSNSKTNLSNSESTDRSKQWLCENNSLPPSFLNPDHQSTPIRSIERGDTDHSRTINEITVEENSETFNRNESDGQSTNVSFNPGDLTTPILGFETMESRSKFTVSYYQILMTFVLEYLYFHHSVF